MNTFLDCIPCLIRQSLAAVRLVTLDERVHEQVLREALQAAWDRMDLSQPPAAMSQVVHRRIRELCRNGDPQIYFLLRVKCPVIARDVGCSVGTMVPRSSRARVAEVVEGMRP